MLSGLSKSDMEALSKLLRKSYVTKYQIRSKKPLYRNIYRVFNHDDLLKFFSCIKKNEVKHGLAFFLMLTCGFRIGEVATLKLENIDFNKGIVKVMTEKASVSSDQVIPETALAVIKKWVEVKETEIKSHNGHLFYSGNYLLQREVVSKDSLKNYFQKFRKRCNLIETYAIRNNGNNTRLKEKNELYKLNSHSFRRTYATTLYQLCKKTELVNVLLRHEKQSVTSQYVYFTHTEQSELVNVTFNKEPYETIAKELIEKMGVTYTGVDKNKFYAHI